MYSLTQGTIITGVRSDKYSNIRCNGVVISARCDLANCKISKIYYLIAVPSDDWLLSDEGFNIVLSQRQNDLEDKLQTKLGGSGLDWSTLKSFSVEEFSIQIKGRTDCTIEEYYQIPRISNALPVETQKDKEFVFSIFLEYQNMLRISSVYDIDDITVQALAQWNAPIWRRERRDSGFDYIFVDEMHLFNINEQHVFHYLTKSAEQKHLPLVVVSKLTIQLFYLIPIM